MGKINNHIFFLCDHTQLTSDASDTTKVYMTSPLHFCCILLSWTDHVQIKNMWGKSRDGAAWLNTSPPAALCKLTEIMWFTQSTTTPSSAYHRLVPQDGEYSTKKVHRLLRQTTEQALSPCAGCRKQNWEGKNEKWQDIDLLIATLQTHRSGGWVGGWLSVVHVW